MSDQPAPPDQALPAPPAMQDWKAAQTAQAQRDWASNVATISRLLQVAVGLLALIAVATVVSAFVLWENLS